MFTFAVPPLPAFRFAMGETVVLVSDPERTLRVSARARRRITGQPVYSLDEIDGAARLMYVPEAMLRAVEANETARTEARFVLDQPVIVDGDRGVIQAIAEFSGDGLVYRVATPSFEGLTDLQWFAPEAIRPAAPEPSR